MYSPALICLMIYPFQITAIFFINNACRDLQSYALDTVLPTTKCYHSYDVLSDVPHIVKRYGYIFNFYSVTTNSGYKLTVFRVRSRRKKKENPVFIQHGISTNAGPWVDIKDRSIAFYLADMGYDVWLGNVRGTTYSRKHTTMDVSDPSYWNFNLDSLSQKDLRIQLHLVANKTGNNGDIVYIGHSMGTTLGFMYFSEYPDESKSLVKGYIALAPVVYFDNVTQVELIKPVVPPLINLLESLNLKGVFYKEEITHRTIITLCRLFPDVCYKMLTIIYGKSEEFPFEDLLLYFSYFPTGTSIYQYEQYGQIALSGIFQKYDFGLDKNMELYGTPNPAVYNLSNINIPVWLLYGRSDSLTSEKSIDRLYRELGTDRKKKQPIPDSGNISYFNHIDFLYAANIKTLLYTHIVKALNEL